jgi:GNAT superfamily N-acetyltransferase
MQKLFTPTDVEYGPTAQRVFTFLRHCSEGAYSSRTMMALVTQADTGEAPFMAIDDADVEIDRLTEVKQGGIRAVGAVLRDGRVMLATHPEYRRQGYGSQLVYQILNRVPAERHLQFWVHTRNLDAQRFLLSQGLEIVAQGNMNLCYGTRNGEWPL